MIYLFYLKNYHLNIFKYISYKILIIILMSKAKANPKDAGKKADNKTGP